MYCTLPYLCPPIIFIRLFTAIVLGASVSLNDMIWCLKFGSLYDAVLAAMLWRLSAQCFNTDMHFIKTCGPETVGDVHRCVTQPQLSQLFAKCSQRMQFVRGPGSQS